MMQYGPALIDLIVELHDLRPIDRRAILERFEPFEREIIENMLRKVAEPAPPSFDALASLSPWLAESLGTARSLPSNLTPATREALIEAEQVLPRAAPPARPAKPSLLDKMLKKGARQ